MGDQPGEGTWHPASPQHLLLLARGPGFNQGALQQGAPAASGITTALCVSACNAAATTTSSSSSSRIRTKRSAGRTGDGWRCRTGSGYTPGSCAGPSSDQRVGTVMFGAGQLTATHASCILSSADPGASVLAARVPNQLLAALQNPCCHGRLLPRPAAHATLTLCGPAALSDCGRASVCTQVFMV
jgi:hypothetical protein